jgi:hypothetical protein
MKGFAYGSFITSLLFIALQWRIASAEVVDLTHLNPWQQKEHGKFY